MALLCAIILPSCKTNQVIAEDQYYLKKNQLVFKTDEKIENKDILRFELESLYQQIQNPSKIWPPKNWLDRDTAVVYDALLAEKTGQVMEKFLKNKKGFYHVNVKPSTAYDGSSATVSYLLDLGRRYKIKSYEIISKDQTIVTDIKNLQSIPAITVGDPLDADLFEQERSRITSGLQNLGYANFVTNYIEIVGDSSDYQVDVEFNILVPPPDSIHKQYYIGEVNVYTEHLSQANPDFNLSDTINNTIYYSKSDQFVVKPKKLRNNIFLREGMLYLKDNRVKTQKTLSNLSSFRYVNIKEKANAETDTIIDFDIFLSPHKHKWISETGLDLFYSTFGATNIQQNLFGMSASTSLQNRNLLGGSEKYSFNLDGSLEMTLPSLEANRWSFGANNVLELPRLVDLFSFGKFLSNIRIIPRVNYIRLKEEAKTDISLGYNFSKTIQNFSISSFNASWGYSYKPNNKQLFKVRQLGLNLFIFNPTEQFQTINLDPNPLLAKSFEDNVSTGFLFRDLSYFYQGPKNKKGRSLGFLGNIEFSGMEVFLGNKFYNLLSGSDLVWELGPGGRFNFAKFVKLELDGRIYKDLSPSSQLAARADFGIVVPFGRTSEGTLLTVPYLSQFYVGGPNSNRAWQLRELGPGGYLERSEPPFFQAGDLKLEFNLEYRWDWFWFFKGAVFVDAGNIWTLRDEFNKDGVLLREGSKFSTNFIDQMAIGAGWGIRADFTYFLIRFDFGYKIRAPYPVDDSGSHFVIGKKVPGTDDSFNAYIGNINVAINYPF